MAQMKARMEFYQKAHFDSNDRVWRWNSSEQIPPIEVLTEAGIHGLKMMARSNALRESEQLHNSTTGN